eukprot:40792_1
MLRQCSHQKRKNNDTMLKDNPCCDIIKIKIQNVYVVIIKIRKKNINNILPNNDIQIGNELKNEIDKDSSLYFHVYKCILVKIRKFENILKGIIIKNPMEIYYNDSVINCIDSIDFIKCLLFIYLLLMSYSLFGLYSKHILFKSFMLMQLHLLQSKSACILEIILGFLHKLHLYLSMLEMNLSKLVLLIVWLLFQLSCEAIL